MVNPKQLEGGDLKVDPHFTKKAENSTSPIQRKSVDLKPFEDLISDSSFSLLSRSQEECSYGKMEFKSQKFETINQQNAKD